MKNWYLLVALGFFLIIVLGTSPLWVDSLRAYPTEAAVVATLVCVGYAILVFRVGTKMSIIVIALLAVAGTASAGDSDFRWDKKSVEQEAPKYYGVGTQCVMATSYYGATAVIDEEEVVHLAMLTRQGAKGWSRNRKTNVTTAFTTSNPIVQTMCKDAIREFTEEDPEAARRFLLARN